MTHTISRRGGTKTATQRSRCARKYRVWRPKPSAMKAALSELHSELWAYLRPFSEGNTRRATIHTDEHPLYRSLFTDDAIAHHFMLAGLLEHRRTPASAPRTFGNPLFAVSYVDRLLRHRLKEHTRESIAIGRHAALQMHRAWMFAWDHNAMREYRVKHPQLASHAEHAGSAHELIAELDREFSIRRIMPAGIAAPPTISQAWLGQLPTPPLRWKVGQRGSSVRVPRYAVRDLVPTDQHPG